MNRSYSFFLFLVLFILPVSSRVLVAQPPSAVDVFPLAVGNQWTYSYHMWSADVYQDILTTEVGTARYAILSGLTAQDSTRWVFQEFRDVTRCINFTFPPGRDTCYRVLDSAQFEIVEMHEGQHLLWRQGMFYDVWSSVFPFSRDLTDTTAIYRYQRVDSTLSNSFETHPPGEYPAMTFFLSFKKDTGVVSTNAETRFLTGSMLTTNHELMGAVITGVDDGTTREVPREIVLHQNYPNPFNPTTAIKFQVPSSNVASLKVYDMLGREVATLVNEVTPAGIYEVHWDARGVTSGVYFCRLRAGTFTSTKKMILIR